MSNRHHLPDLGVRPLSARSLALSALLGTHPPRLPARALVVLGARFGIAEGTMRTALSRMVDAGELVGEEGRYELGEQMATRQRTQDAGRRPVEEPWDGAWWFAIVDADRRPIGERRVFRRRMRDHRMGELRPDLWLRPANLAGPEPGTGIFVVRGRIEGRDPVELARRLWDLDRLRSESRVLTALNEEALGWLATDGADALVDTVVVSVATVRVLLADPLLPEALVGPAWPVGLLRSTYDRLERAHNQMMASFLTQITDGSAITSLDLNEQKA